MSSNKDLEKWNILPDYLKVAVEIVKFRRDGEVPYFSAIVESVGIGESKVHSAVHQLTDTGSINDGWEKIGTRWVRGFTVGHIEEDYFNILCDNIYT